MQKNAWRVKVQEGEARFRRGTGSGARVAGVQEAEARLNAPGSAATPPTSREAPKTPILSHAQEPVVAPRVSIARGTHDPTPRRFPHG